MRILGAIRTGDEVGLAREAKGTPGCVSVILVTEITSQDTHHQP